MLVPSDFCHQFKKKKNMGTNGGIYIVYIVHLHLLDFTGHFQKKKPFTGEGI